MALKSASGGGSAGNGPTIPELMYHNEQERKKLWRLWGRLSNIYRWYASRVNRMGLKLRHQFRTDSVKGGKRESIEDINARVGLHPPFYRSENRLRVLKARKERVELDIKGLDLDYQDLVRKHKEETRFM